MVWLRSFFVAARGLNMSWVGLRNPIGLSVQGPEWYPDAARDLGDGQELLCATRISISPGRVPGCRPFPGAPRLLELK